MSDQPKVDLFDLDALSKSNGEISDHFFPDDAETVKDGEKYVVFEIDQKNYAIPSEFVAEVVRPLPITVIPNTPQWFLGISNLRGDILSVIDLSGFIGDGQGEPSQKSKLVVLSVEDSDSNLALRVDRLREIVVLSEENIEVPADKSLRHLAGIAEYKSAQLNVLNTHEIISSLSIC